MLAESLAVVLRALRHTRGLAQERLPSSRSYVTALESGKSKISLDKLWELSNSLEITPLALMVMCESISRNQDVAEILDKLEKEVQFLRSEGLEQKLLEEKQSSSFVSKAKTRKLADSRRHAVKRLKEEGMSRKDVSKTLGISKSSVQRFWN